MRPADGTWADLGAAGVALQVLGGCFTLVAFCYLGRSFGVVAANRGLKVSGPYRFVRHPIYASHTLTTGGFLLANFSPINAALFLVITAAQIARIEAEERLLTATASYGDYRGRVRWRLLPGLY
jgi:protein-S-isoprenylcysteine O-methyltransferase Ste14